MTSAPDTHERRATGRRPALPRAPAAFRALVVLALGPAAGAADPARADDLPQLDFALPLSVEGGPVIAPALGVAPASYVWGSVAAAGGSWSVGQAGYTEVFGRVVLGGAWSPSFFERLSFGGELVVLTGHSIHTTVPPALDEWTTDFDLGELRVTISGLAWATELPDDELQLGVRPHVRLTLPSDISRWNEGRRAAPLRRVLGDDVRDHEFVGVDLGGTFAL
ncbi:MAG: hypothetical protein JXB32_05310, partial [Deltaproteobacteria bacterium]|nr:hypothetical protein [Deltaproteobacteria bacterium]